MKIEIPANKLDQAEASRMKALEERKANVLIIDDEPGNLISLEHLLSPHYRVFACEDPREALGVFGDEHIDIVLSDQRMPEMLGTELLEQLKIRDDDNIRIIVTGYTDARDLIQCINKDLIHKYVMKPWAPGDILSLVQESLEFLTEKRKLDKLLAWARQNAPESAR
ncbi:MAG: response regulator [Myxococcota bacterium]|nr:response regulator [Myxococcota bacterium]